MISFDFENSRLHRFTLWFLVTTFLFITILLLTHNLKVTIQATAPFAIILSVLTILKWEKKVVLDAASKASVITIATSPFFINQELAIKVFKDIFS